MNARPFLALAAAILRGTAKKTGPHGVGAGFIEQSEYNGLGIGS